MHRDNSGWRRGSSTNPAFCTTSTPERQSFKSPVKSGHDRPGYNFDGCPPEVMLTRMKVKDGRIVLPDGMSYRMLALPQTPTMTPELLRKIRDLAKAGATVLGAPPLKSPSLQGYPKCDDEVDGCTRVPIRFGPSGSAFVVFRDGDPRSPRFEFQEFNSFRFNLEAPSPHRAAGAFFVVHDQHRPVLQFDCGRVGPGRGID